MPAAVNHEMSERRIVPSFGFSAAGVTGLPATLVGSG
jgi:hypothetical protein